MANEYGLGSRIRCTGAYTDINGIAHDPESVFGEFVDPSGNETSYEYGQDAELVRSATGVYYFDVDTDEAGWWYYRHYATGAGKAGDENKFRVKESRFD